MQVFCLVEFRNRFSRIEIWLRSTKRRNAFTQQDNNTKIRTAGIYCIQDLFVDLACAAAGSQRRPPRARPAPLLEKDLVTLQQTGLGHSPAPARGGWCVPTRPCRPDLVDPLAISSALQAGLGPTRAALTRRTRTLLLQRPAHSARRRGQARPWAPFQCFSAVLCVRKTTARAVGAAGSRSGCPCCMESVGQSH